MRFCLSVRLLFVVLLAVAALQGCTRHVNPAPPVATGGANVYKPELSIINIPIEIPNKLLEDSLNANVRGVLVNDLSYDYPIKDDLKITVAVSGRIYTATKDDVFYSAIPLKVWAQGRYEVSSIGPVIEKETSFEAIVYFATKLSVSKDFRLVTTTTPGGYTWITEPKIYLGPVPINIKFKVETELDKSLKTSALEIDRNITTGIDFRSNVLTIWKQLHEPVLIDSLTQSWLKMQPVEFFMAPIKGAASSLKLNFGLKTYIETYTGKKPDFVVNPVLPDLKTGALSGNTFAVNLSSFITFQEATNIANRAMAGQTYKMGRKQVQVDSLKLWGIDNRLAASASLSKALTGVVYLSGLPEYSIEDRKLAMKKVDFDFNTKNVLLKSASWMLDGLFTKKVEQNMVFQLNQQLDSVRDDINRRLNNYSYQNLFYLKGQVSSIDVQGVYIEPTGIRVTVAARGTANIIVGLKPKNPAIKP